jgi:hypothetical protein
LKKTNWTVGLLGVRNALLILGGIGLQKSNKQKTNGTGVQTMRDRLIELFDEKIRTMKFNNSDHWFDFTEKSKELADYLLANGVIVPPCKVGQIVWLIRNNKIEETTVEKIVLKDKGLYLKLLCNSFYETTCRSIGKTVFLTKEEAEAKLKELGK